MKLLILSPGPKYNIEHEFSARLEGMSEFSSGTVITAGPCRAKATFKNFEVQRYRDPYGKSFITTFFLLFGGGLLLLKALFKKSPYDCIVTYDPLKTGLIGLVLSRFFSAKLIVEVNGNYLNDAIYHEVRSPLKRKLKKAMFKFVAGFVLKRSHGVKRLYPLQTAGFDLAERTVIGSFEDYVQMSKFSWQEDAREVLFVGFPFYIKGVDILISAFKKAYQEHPGWKLKIMGYYPNPDELYKCIGGHPGIEHHPPVDVSEMPLHMGRCGMFVLPSRTEAMGRVLLEAMACGKARIGSNVEGIPTVIEDGVDGLLFDKGNDEDLYNKMSLLMRDESLRKKIGDAAFSRSKSNFSEAAYFKRTEEFYRDVLSA